MLSDRIYIQMSDSEKCAIFIDGGYFNRVLKDQFGGLKIDYLELCNKICSDLKLNRLRTYFYHCMPVVRKDNKEDLIKQANMQKFLTRLKRQPRFEVRLGRLQEINSQFKQKMVDVLMSLDIVIKSYEKQIQHAVLIAGDSDFIPAIKKAKDNGTIVHLYYHPSSVHNEILDEIDELHEIDKNLIENCSLK